MNLPKANKCCYYCKEVIYDYILLKKLECSCADCEHYELDHTVCIDCGKDQFEWLSMKAYDDAKNARYE